jgi:hypothetical protein
MRFAKTQWWYENVHKSTGWQTSVTEYYPATSKYRTLDPLLMPALKASFPAYEFLRNLTISHLKRGPPLSEMYEDPRNEHLLVWIGAPGRGRLLPRDMAGVSPWDSSVQGGDACWEGIRVYRGKIFSLDKHLRRLFRSAKALGFENVHTKKEVTEAIFRTLAANGMRDHAHIRLTLTRGEKCTSSMNPKFNVYGTTLIILPEWKPTEVSFSFNCFIAETFFIDFSSNAHNYLFLKHRAQLPTITQKVSCSLPLRSVATHQLHVTRRSITTTW